MEVVYFLLKLSIVLIPVIATFLFFLNLIDLYSVDIIWVGAFAAMFIVSAIQDDTLNQAECNIIEYSGEYFITANSGNPLSGSFITLESEEEPMDIIVSYKQGSLYSVGDTITCSFTKEENLANIDNFVVTKVFTVQDKMDSGLYECYYNGEDVEPKKIDISMYEYKVNEAKKCIYLANKQEKRKTNSITSTTIIPYVIP